MKLLKNEAVVLRAIEPTDLDDIFRWENDSSIWEVGSNIAPFSKFQIAEYIRTYTADIYTMRQLRLMIEENESGQTVGMIDLFDFDFFHSRAYLGTLVDHQFKGMGFGKAASGLILDYASHFLGLHQIIANIPQSNIPCLKLYEQLGFERTGILKDWTRHGNTFEDVIVMQKLF